MKYILKYESKSKYFGFSRAIEKEFNTKKDMLDFIIKKKLTKWQIYKLETDTEEVKKKWQV